MASHAPPPVTIDCDYLHPRFAAAYLVTDGDEAAFVDNNTAHSVPNLLQALKKAGMGPEQVRYVIITHVHLDHAGGSSALMKACPAATLLAHPRAAVHMIDPHKLVASARHVYGESEFARLYGEIDPIPEARVRAVNDGEEIALGSRPLKFLHTRGHANHHFVVQDPGSSSIFTGDAFGLAYPVLQKAGLFIFPSTSPTDFDPVEARKSVRRIVETGAATAYLTHFGGVSALAEAASQLVDWIDFSESVLNEAQARAEVGPELAKFCESRLRPKFQAELDRRGMGSDAAVWDLIRLDLELNASGIAHVAKKRRAV